MWCVRWASTNNNAMRQVHAHTAISGWFVANAAAYM